MTTSDAPIFDGSTKTRWRGEKFRLVRDHYLLRYFVIRREDAGTPPKFCTVESTFQDGRHAIHDRELVVAARRLRFHPSYLRPLADIHICELRELSSRAALIQSGLVKPGDDEQLIELILAMIDRDRRFDQAVSE